MKTIGSPRPWPPEVCDETRQQLARYSWSQRSKAATDDLFAILAELDGWLADQRSYNKNSRKPEWSSLIDDVRAAFDLVGGQLRALLPSADELLAGLHDGLGVKPTERAALAGVLARVRGELSDPAAPGAAFSDLVEAVKNPDARSVDIEGKVDVLDAVLRFSDRSLRGVSLVLPGILNNDGWWVHVARHELDGEERRHHQELDDDAGLSEEERFMLATRWVGHRSAAAHHVVWLFYGNARLGSWRLTVGGCEFFNGPALLSALAEIDQIRRAGGAYPGDRHELNTLPLELISDGVAGRYLREELYWPEGDHWVGVRVDLGIGTYPDVVEAARDQVRALLALAAFDRGGTSWTELTGHKHFIDRFEGGSSMPYEDPDVERKWSEADYTGDWLDERQAELGTHLAAGSRAPEAHAVIVAATALANTTQATPSIELLEAVRVIETQASGSPAIDVDEFTCGMAA